jgi:uncharacterized protein (DUF1697 family)
MARFAAFPRGMNLGRHRRVTNDALRSAFERAGMTEVATFRASGNVAFTAPSGTERRLVARLESGLERDLGFPVPIFVRSARELAAIAAAVPFAPDVLAASKGKLQVCLLAAKPPAQARERVRELAAGVDAVEFAGRELYWLPSGGVLTSALDMAALARTLGSMTVRTKGTVEQFAARCFETSER